MSDSIVIIPTYNEKENIENIIRAVFGLEKVFHILVIDDGSPDGTAAIVKGLQKEFPERLFIVKGSWDWVPLISGVLNGLSSINMILFSRWTPISVIIPMTCRSYTPLVPRRVPT